MAEDPETQLAEIEELLQASPGDEALLALKRDLVELISLTKGGDDAISEATPSHETPEEVKTLNDRKSLTAEDDDDDPELPPDPQQQLSDQQELVPTTTATPPVAATTTPPSEKVKTTKKAKKRLKEFQVPAHLQIKDTDSEAEKKRKKRQIKAAKSKWRAEKKDFESTKKQQSWQSFQKKNKKKRAHHGGESSSIFATRDGVNAKVGVVAVGTGGMTEFESKKRHKH